MSAALNSIYSWWSEKQRKGFGSRKQFSVAIGVDAGNLSRTFSGKQQVSGLLVSRVEASIPDLPAKLRDALRKEIAHPGTGLAVTAPKERRYLGDAAQLVRGSTSQFDHVEMNNIAKRISRKAKFNVKFGRYVIAAAVEGAPTHKGFLAAIENYQEREGAQLALFPARPHYRALEDRIYPLDPFLLKHHTDDLYSSVEFGNYLTAADIDLRPTAGDPLSGLGELGANEGHSFIFSHPTRRLRSLPNPGGIAVRTQMTTGTISQPVYRDNKQGRLAANKHFIGAVIVEIVDGAYHTRYIQARADGSFVDAVGGKPKVYHPDGSVTDAKVAWLTRGDEHGGPHVFGDAEVDVALTAAIKEFKPKRLLLHDLMDSVSVSHHNIHNISARLSKPAGAEDLATELNSTTDHIDKLYAVASAVKCQIYVIPSNHNDHVAKYLDSGRWINDDKNYLTALELAYQYHKNGHSPVQWWIDPEEKKAIWLSRGDSLRVEGVELNNHGDAGIGGSRGNIKQDAVAYGATTAGHSHAAGIYGDATRVGTSTRLDLPYVMGPSEWAHAFEVGYEGGGRQLYFIINGKYRM